MSKFSLSDLDNMSPYCFGSCREAKCAFNIRAVIFKWVLFVRVIVGGGSGLLGCCLVDGCFSYFCMSCFFFSYLAVTLFPVFSSIICFL